MEKYKEEQAFYPKPHCLIQLVQQGYLTKAEYILLDILLHLENMFAGQKGNWFFHTDKTICETRLISPKPLSRARAGLKHKGFIDCKDGNSHKATDYRILSIPDTYNAESSM